MKVEEDVRVQCHLNGARRGEGEETDLGGGARGDGNKGNVGAYEWARGEVDRNRKHVDPKLW